MYHIVYVVAMLPSFCSIFMASWNIRFSRSILGKTVKKSILCNKSFMCSVCSCFKCWANIWSILSYTLQSRDIQKSICVWWRHATEFPYKLDTNFISLLLISDKNTLRTNAYCLGILSISSMFETQWKWYTLSYLAFQKLSL